MSQLMTLADVEQAMRRSFMSCVTVQFSPALFAVGSKPSQGLCSNGGCHEPPVAALLSSWGKYARCRRHWMGLDPEALPIVKTDPSDIGHPKLLDPRASEMVKLFVDDLLTMEEIGNRWGLTGSEYVRS